MESKGGHPYFVKSLARKGERKKRERGRGKERERRRGKERKGEERKGKRRRGKERGKKNTLAYKGLFWIFSLRSGFNHHEASHKTNTNVSLVLIPAMRSLGPQRLHDS